MRARHWYHCSREHHEPSWTAVRRAPIIAAPTEPPTPRLCVAPSVAQALSACWWSPGRGVAVYLTPLRRTVPPRGVFDQAMTGERWIIPPVTLSLLAIIPAAAIEWAQDGLEPGSTEGYALEWARRSERLMRMAYVVREHLPEARERWVERFAERVNQHFLDRAEAEVEKLSVQLC